MKKFDAVLFDLDGTLIDSAPGIFDSFEYTLKHYGISLPREQMRRFLGPPLRDSFAGLLDSSEIERAVTLYRTHYAVASTALTKVYAGVPELLQKLKDSGYTICLATSKPLNVAQKLMRELKLDRYFDFAGGASEDTSLDTKAAVIGHVLAQPCTEGKSVLMIGDRDNDMIGAAECNIPAVGVRYGYASAGELEAFHPLYLAENPEDLCTWLLSMKK